MKRQELTVTIYQLRMIADDLEKQVRESYKKANCDFPEFVAINQQLFQINIINRKNLSDTWEFKDV